jgi:hypothetical protein
MHHLLPPHARTHTQVGLDLITSPVKSPRKTKVVCTLGPACWDEAGLAALIDAGMNVARFNFSHGDHEGHAAVLQRLRKVWVGACVCDSWRCVRAAAVATSINAVLPSSCTRHARHASVLHHTSTAGVWREERRARGHHAGHKGPRDPHRHAEGRAGHPADSRCV